MTLTIREFLEAHPQTLDEEKRFLSSLDPVPEKLRVSPCEY
jgi:hypothetical protein